MLLKESRGKAFDEAYGPAPVPLTVGHERIVLALRSLKCPHYDRLDVQLVSPHVTFELSSRRRPSAGASSQVLCLFVDVFSMSG